MSVRLSGKRQAQAVAEPRKSKEVDSSGVSAIVELYVSLEGQGGQLKLLSPRGLVLEVLTLFRLLEVIPSFDDEAQAFASFRTGIDEERLEVVGAEANTTSNSDRFWNAVDHWEKDQPEIFLEFSGPIEGIFKGTVAQIKGKTVTFRDVETEEELSVNFDEAEVRFHSFSRFDAICSFCALWMDESTLQTAKCVLTESRVL